MVSNLRVLAQLVLAPLAAHGFRLSPSWQSARPTDAVDADTGHMANLRLSPPPTPGPVLPELLKRDEARSCAYESGKLGNSSTVHSISLSV
jgi:hypothetical protein